jgi:hypothetical protein
VHLMFFFDQQIRQVRPDEAGDAGDQVAHVRVEADPLEKRATRDSVRRRWTKSLVCRD